LKTVSFQYQTELLFSSPASEHRFILRILPPNDSRQRIKNPSWRIDPSPVVWRTTDGFGNEALSGFINAPHNHFRFGIEAMAEVTDAPYTVCPEPERVLLCPTELTQIHGALSAFYNDTAQSAPNGIAPEDILQRVQYLAHAVHTSLRYERGITSSATTAQEAFDGGAGVCQDYAHILLALLRQGGIPCRYVAGLASDYGETHAWVEAWIGDRYYGIDPTRDKLIDEGYIALSRGRDFEDCSVERGVFKGACRGTQTIKLSMEISP
jgi:transglutaminase-like putative cysteine protease